MTPPTESRRSSPCDGAYKHLFSHPEMIEPLLRGFVHEDWVERLDFSGLEKLNASYVSDELLQRNDDIVWRLPLCREAGDGEGAPQWLYLYLLLEFQSRPDAHMALRLLTYVCLLYQDLLKSKQVGAGQRLPPVFPLVLYNGQPRWHAPRKVGQLIDAPGSLQRWVPGFRYELLDEARIAPEALAALHGNLMACLVALEHAPEPRALQQVVSQLARLRKSQTNLHRAFTVFIHRVVLRKLVPDEIIEALQDLQEIDSMLAERVIEWTEKWKREGLQEGLQEGRLEGERLVLQRQLTRRFGALPPEVIQRLAQADASRLEIWADRVLDAATLVDVVGPSAV